MSLSNRQWYTIIGVASGVWLGATVLTVSTATPQTSHPALAHTTIGKLATPRPAVPPGPRTVALEHTNKNAQRTLWQQMLHDDPQLPARWNGAIPRTLMGAPAPQSIGWLARDKSAIIGVHRLWSANAAYIQNDAPTIHAGGIPATVWQAGFRAAASDLSLVVGNDPLAVVLKAGPGSAPKFRPLEMAAYTSQWSELHDLRWTYAIQVTLGSYANGPPFSLGPVTRQIAGTPRVRALMQVPMTLKETVAQRVHGHEHFAVVTQTGGETMALTKSRGDWEWWVEQAVLNPPRILPGPRAS
jgi:hypothetical protein